MPSSTGFNELAGPTSLRDYSPPGMDDRGNRTPKTGNLLPREWYASFSNVFAVSEENEIYPDLTSVGVLNADLESMINVAFAVEQTAFAIHRDMDNMDANDAIVASAMDTLTDASLGVEIGGPRGDGKPIYIECKQDPIVIEILMDLCDRIDLFRENKLWQIGRNALKYGTEFREIVLDPTCQSKVQEALFPNLSGCITRFDHRPEHQMWPKFDAKGNKQGGAIQKGRFSSFREDTAIQFEEWQYCSFVFGEERWGKGTPLFGCTRRTWRKLQYLEEGLILARITRAYPKYLHKIPVPVGLAGDEKGLNQFISNYKTAITTKRQLNLTTGNVETQFNPMDVTTDIYVSKYFYPQPGTEPITTDVEVLEASNVQLTQLVDIEYLLDKIITRSGVPRRYLAREEKNGANPQNMGVGQEDIQFTRKLKTIQSMLERGLRKLFNMELILHGIDPNEIDYIIKFPIVSSLDRLTEAQVEVQNAQAAQAWQNVFGGGLPTELIVERWFKAPNEDTSELVQKIEEGKKQAQAEAEQLEAKRAMAYNAPDMAEKRGVYADAQGGPDEQGGPPQGGGDMPPNGPPQGGKPFQQSNRYHGRSKRGVVRMLVQET